MIRLLSQPELRQRFGRAGRRMVEAQYSSRGRGAALSEYFQRLQP
jgi:glycosyltransferase involved in cell wall biosynthesis